MKRSLLVFALLTALAFTLSGCFTLLGGAIGSGIPCDVPISGSTIGRDVHVETNDNHFVDGHVKSDDGKLIVIESGQHSYELPLDRVRRIGERKSYANEGAGIGGIIDTLVFVGSVFVFVVFGAHGGYGGVGLL